MRISHGKPNTMLFINSLKRYKDRIVGNERRILGRIHKRGNMGAECGWLHRRIFLERRMGEGVLQRV
jgi:hypothetical protein